MVGLGRVVIGLSALRARPRPRCRPPGRGTRTRTTEGRPWRRTTRAGTAWDGNVRSETEYPNTTRPTSSCRPKWLTTVTGSPITVPPSSVLGSVEAPDTTPDMPEGCHATTVTSIRPHDAGHPSHRAHRRRVSTATGLPRSTSPHPPPGGARHPSPSISSPPSITNDEPDSDPVGSDPPRSRTQRSVAASSFCSWAC